MLANIESNAQSPIVSIIISILFVTKESIWNKINSPKNKTPRSFFLAYFLSCVRVCIYCFYFPMQRNLYQRERSGRQQHLATLSLRFFMCKSVCNCIYKAHSKCKSRSSSSSFFKLPFIVKQYKFQFFLLCPLTNSEYLFSQLH